MKEIIRMWDESSTLPIDELLAKFQSKHNCYVCYPNLFVQTVQESHIRKDEKHWDLEKLSKKLRWDLTLYT